MEDHNQSRNQSKSADKEKIIDLSADMALPDQAKHKIIDLTDDIDNPADQTETPPVQEPPQEEVAEVSDNKSIDAKTDQSAPLASDVEDILSTTEIESPASAVNETTDAFEDEVDSVEEEVDAAFDAVAVQPPELSASIEDDLLFDELSDITQEIDDAVGKPNMDDPIEEDPSDEIKVPAESLDEDTLTVQAAELDAAMAGDDHDAAEISDSETAEQEGIDIPQAVDTIQDDDIIELVDVVDPDELEALEAEAAQEDEIIELTHIVDVDELDKLEGDDQNKSADLETNPTQFLDETETEHLKKEEELTLSESGMDDDSLFAGNLEDTPVTDDIFDSTELDNLFDDEIAEDAIPDDLAIAAESSMEDIDGLFDIEDELSSIQITEEKTTDDIESIPSLEETDGLFDIEDQFDGVQMTEEFTSDAIEPTPDDIDGAPAPLEEKHEDQEQVIQLVDILKSSKAQPSSADPTPIPEADISRQHVTMETPDEADASDLNGTDDSVRHKTGLDDEKIEAAVEQIIRTKYADKIEQLIATAVEKAVTQEIENIKRTLSDNDEPLA